MKRDNLGQRCFAPNDLAAFAESTIEGQNPMRFYSSAVKLAIAGLLVLSAACITDAESRLGPDTEGMPVTVVLTPNSLTASTGQVVQLGSYGLNAAGDSIAVNLDWEADGGAVGVTGTFLSVQSGVFQVIGRSPGSPFPADTTTITITAAPVTLVGIELIPEQPIIAPGLTRPFLAEGVYSDSSRGPVLVEWTATGGSIDAQGLFTAGSTEGSYLVTAASLDGLVSDSTGVTISTTAPVVQDVVLSPDSIQVQRSASVRFQAYARFSDGSFAPVSASYATTSGTITSAGLLTAGTTPGVFSIIATAVDGGIADTAALVVSNSSLSQILLSPPSIALQSGSTQQFSVLGILENGTSAPVTATFSATGGEISTGGIFTAGDKPGVFSVVATSTTDDLADTAIVAVAGPEAILNEVVLSPSQSSLLPGGKQQFTAIGLLTDGSSTTILVNYAASGGTINANGLYTAPMVTGNYFVIATAAGGALADTAIVAVNAASQLTGISLTPDTSQIVIGALQQFTAIGTLAGGGQSSVNVTYSATGGTISAGGQYSAGNTPGSYIVTAVHGASGFSDSSVVLVVDLPPSGSNACAHEPAGYSPVFDQPFDARPPDAPALDSYGWNVRASDGFRVSADTDPAAPKSPAGVLRGWFRQGGNGGGAPFSVKRDFGRNLKEVYVCLFTKLDPSYTNNGNTGTKFGFLLTPYHGGAQGLNHYFNLTNRLGINLQSSGATLNRNMQSSFNLVNHRGVWHKLEFLVIGNSLGNSDGIARMWVNDAKVLDVNDVQYFFPAQTAAFDGITWNPTYGGGHNPIPYDMYQWVDNWYVSGR